MKTRLLILTFVLLFVLPVTLAATQVESPAPRIEITGVNATQLPTVTITANVYDSLGQPLSGLSISDFTLSGELGDRAELVSVENITDDNLSFATVLVIDVSSSMAETPINNAKEAAKAFVSAIGPNDPVAIVLFSTSARLVQDYTTDKTVLLNVIDAIGVGGKTALYDAGVAGVEKAAESPLPRRAVVLLSDGAEYGGVSAAERAGALDEAIIRGVPVYTIGLGYGIDRSYLQELSSGTNARNYESPSPDELITIYRSLANLLRSQYVLTLNVDVPLDGTVYNLDATATTPEGDTNTVTASLRAPIPVPIVSFPEIPVEPISEPLEISADVAADDDIVSIQFMLDGEVVETDGLSVTIDPATLSPGAHTLTLTVVDGQGDTNTGTLNFEVAALAPNLIPSVDLGSLGEITEPQTITVEVGGQTLPVNATVMIDGETVAVIDAPPFEFSFDPFDLTPGEHTLSIEVLNAGGETAAITQTFTIGALAPVVSVTGLDDSVLESSPTINVDVTSQTAVTEVVFGIDGQPVTSLSDAPFTFTFDILEVAPGSHTLTVEVTNEGGKTSVEEFTFEVSTGPSLTATASAATDTPMPSDTPVPPSNTPVPPSNTPVPPSVTPVPPSLTPVPPTNTSTTTSTATDTSTSTTTNTVTPTDAEATAVAQAATDTATMTETPTDTDTAQPTDTDTAQPTDTDTAQPTDTDTAQPTDTDTAQPTDTETLVPTTTPVEITDVPVPDDTSSNQTTLIIIIIVIVIIVVLAYFFIFRNRQQPK